MIELIKTIKLDVYTAQIIKNIRHNGGKFLILSAGADYYIKKGV